MINPDPASDIGRRVVYEDEAGEERGVIKRIASGAAMAWVLYDDGQELATGFADLRWDE